MIHTFSQHGHEKGETTRFSSLPLFIKSSAEHSAWLKAPRRYTGTSATNTNASNQAFMKTRLQSICLKFSLSPVYSHIKTGGIDRLLVEEARAFSLLVLLL